jgi:peptidyl-prolyl cis-trans isomerase C
MKLIASSFLAAALGLALATAAPAAETNAPAKKPADKLAELFGDPVVAQGKNLTIKRSELDAAVMGIKASNLARNQQFSPEQNLMLERQVLDRLIQIQLLLQKATDADRARGKTNTDERFDQLVKRAGSEENLARQLKSVGLTPEELRRKMGEEATAELVVLRELKIEPTDADVKKYYDEYPARFEQPEQVRAAHILLGTLDPETRQPLPEEKRLAKRKQAEEVLKRVKAGEDFAKLAMEFSEDPGSREKGGEYTFARGQMVPQFESTAFSQAPNQVSDLVETQFGYHIIKTIEKLPARKLTLEESLPDGVKVSDRVKMTLRAQQMEKLLPDYVEQLTADAKVEVLDEKMKQAGEMIKQMNAEARKNAAGLDKTETDKKAAGAKK